MSYDLNYKAFGDQAILIEWPARINTSILKDIIAFKAKITSEIEDIIELITGYNSITIKYNNAVEDFQKAIVGLRILYAKPNVDYEFESVTWEIPVCYNPIFGIDLETLSKQRKISVKEIIQLHSAKPYTVYFIGFLPGFLYLGGLDSKLHIDRKANPRLNVSEGSVAIGGQQTGIYPNDSSGGWHIIGKTPVSFFNIDNEQPCFAKTGDKIKFLPVDYNEYLEIEESVKENGYKIKTIVNG